MALTLTDFKQVLLDLHTDAMAVFDAIEEKGWEALLADVTTVMRVKALEAKTDELMAFMFAQHVIQARRLGIDVTKVPGYAESVKRFLGAEVTTDA